MATTPKPPQRSALERWSAPVLLRLHRAPRWTLPVITALLLVGGLLSPNTAIAIVLMSLLLLLLLWLVALSWPLLSVSGRIMRIGVIGAMIFIIVNRAQGRM